MVRPTLQMCVGVWGGVLVCVGVCICERERTAIFVAFRVYCRKVIKGHLLFKCSK